MTEKSILLDFFSLTLTLLSFRHFTFKLFVCNANDGDDATELNTVKSRVLAAAKDGSIKDWQRANSDRASEGHCH